MTRIPIRWFHLKGLWQPEFVELVKLETIHCTETLGSWLHSLVCFRNWYGKYF